MKYITHTALTIKVIYISVLDPLCLFYYNQRMIADSNCSSKSWKLKILLLSKCIVEQLFQKLDNIIPVLAIKRSIWPHSNIFAHISGCWLLKQIGLKYICIEGNDIPLENGSQVKGRYTLLLWHCCVHMLRLNLDFWCSLRKHGINHNLTMMCEYILWVNFIRFPLLLMAKQCRLLCYFFVEKQNLTDALEGNGICQNLLGSVT